jgi:hypothetical protein
MFITIVGVDFVKKAKMTNNRDPAAFIQRNLTIDFMVSEISIINEPA